MPWLKSGRSGTITLAVHVQPGVSRSKISGLYGDRLKVMVAAPPVDGKANRKVEEFLANELNIAKRNVHVVSGQTSRQKNVQIEGCSEEEIRLRLMGS